MKKTLILSMLAVTLLSGCAVTLPFNNRLSYSSVKEVQSSVTLKERQSIYVEWEPSDFPSRIDTQGADGFVGGGSQTRIPTGVAMAARIEEAIGTFADIKKDGAVLKIKVIEARSGFEYSAGIFNVTPVLDVGDIKLTASFSMKDKTWTKTYTSKKKDPSIGGRSSTGMLEAAWDDVAVQVAKDVAANLN